MSLLTRFRHHWEETIGELNRQVAPAYFHDRCERSVSMHLYEMHKRDILLGLSAFFSAFVLLLFLGLAGPGVSELHQIQASEIFQLQGLNGSNAKRILLNGPFQLYSPRVHTHADQLCLWLKIRLAIQAPGDELLRANVQFALRVNGSSSSEEKPEMILDEIGQNKSFPLNLQTYSLECHYGDWCVPIKVLHLIQLQHSKYMVEIHIHQLEQLNRQRLVLDMEFAFETMNSKFINLTIWFRLVFLVQSFLIMFWFTHSLRNHSFIDWSLEQKWTAVLLLLLIFYNNPFYPMLILFGSKLPWFMDALFQCNFYCCLLLFWLSFFHGLRQSKRTWRKFYGPKLLLLGMVWFVVLIMTSWSRGEMIKHPTMNSRFEYEHSFILKLFQLWLTGLISGYLVYLALLMFTAFTQLRSMPYFDLRLKLQGFLTIFGITILGLVSILNSSGEIPFDQNFVLPALAVIPWMYQNVSPSAFLTLYAFSNLYLCACAFFYFPYDGSLSAESRMMRDDPTVSMINDSDEDIIYGEEELTIMNPVDEDGDDQLVETPSPLLIQPDSD